MKRLYIWFITQLFRLPLPIKIRNFIMWPLSSRVLGVTYTAPQKLKAGFKMNAYLGDHLGREMLFYGLRHQYVWEPVTTQIIQALVKSNTRAIIAGTHVGLLALYCRQAMQATDAHVYTFEPVATLATIAEKNIDLNTDLPNIQLVRTALGKTEGTVSMISDKLRSYVSDEPEKEKPTKGGIVETTQTTIDTFVANATIPNLDFLLLDVEGAELNALRGAANTLQSHTIHNIIFEISYPATGGLALGAEIIELLSAYDYSFYIINDIYDATELDAKPSPHIYAISSASDLQQFSHLRYFNVLATTLSLESLAAASITVTKM